MIFKKLENWRKERNIKVGSYDFEAQIKCDVEETFELMGYTDKQQIKGLVSSFMSQYFKPELEPSDFNKIDAHCDKVVFAVNAIELLDYDAKACVLETIKEIGSRKQCPKQREAWSKAKPFGKWEKDRKQPLETLYLADYESCKNKTAKQLEMNI